MEAARCAAPAEMEMRVPPRRLRWDLWHPQDSACFCRPIPHPSPSSSSSFPSSIPLDSTTCSLVVLPSSDRSRRLSTLNLSYRGLAASIFLTSTACRVVLSGAIDLPTSIAFRDESLEFARKLPQRPRPQPPLDTLRNTILVLSERVRYHRSTCFLPRCRDGASALPCGSPLHPALALFHDCDPSCASIGRPLIISTHGSLGGVESPFALPASSSPRASTGGVMPPRARR
ncbi:hypothetical protein ACCO45_011030 [Purpureocillium lilacinum]|uniref:Uncharacterized protein n=1 Tax=Purpureocillium lilacinum TaxID=33203 RepID=A0ACC4DH55_PURLI